MASTWVSLSVDGSPMQTYVATPDGPGPFPAIVFAMHIGGVDECLESYCDRLARAGYVTAAPDLYHRQDKSISFEDLYSAGEDGQRVREMVLAQARRLKGGLDDDEMVRDMEAAADYLKSASGGGDGTIGVAGFCLGGRVSYLVATRNSEIKLAITAYGSDIFKATGDGPSPFANSRHIACPVLGIFGRDDRNPSPEEAEAIDAELTSLGVEHTFHYYADAGHGFMNPFNYHHYNELASEEAWTQLFSFLDEKMGTRSKGLNVSA